MSRTKECDWCGHETGRTTAGVVYCDEQCEAKARRQNAVTPPIPDGRTHHAECWRDRGHHDCALARIEELTRDLRHQTRRADKWASRAKRNTVSNRALVVALRETQAIADRVRTAELERDEARAAVDAMAQQLAAATAKGARATSESEWRQGLANLASAAGELEAPGCYRAAMDTHDALESYIESLEHERDAALADAERAHHFSAAWKAAATRWYFTREQVRAARAERDETERARAVALDDRDRALADAERKGAWLRKLERVLTRWGGAYTCLSCGLIISDSEGWPHAPSCEMRAALAPAETGGETNTTKED
jgi:chromosome segregation ATPase